MLTMTDLFCGAGGSSTGAVDVPGVAVRVASNHWQLAVETHNSNHPDADHICADLSQINPRYFPRTDILWASPECTNHSRAKGRKLPDHQATLWDAGLPDEAAERSRATMWDVPRFAEAHGYRAVIVENVVEAAQWLPFRAWLASMDALGYEHQLVSLNSMHAQTRGLPAPQSRDRLYVVFWRKGDTAPDLAGMQRPKAWCPGCDQIVETFQWWKRDRGRDQVGRYRQQYLYRCANTGCGHQIVEPAWLPAASIIDWTNRGQRIGDRAKPLAPKTRARIAAGIARYWHPIHLEAGGHQYDAADPKHVSHGDPNAYYRAWSVTDPLKTLHTIESKALAIPVEGRADVDRARTVEGPLRTQNTRLETGLAMPPFIAELRGGGSVARPAGDPLATITASGNHHGLITPYYGASREAKSTDDALGTITTVDRYGLVMRNNGSTGDGAEMVTPAGQVMRTITTTGHQSVLTPGDVRAAEAQVDDVMFRMLEPSEAKRGMAFPAEYVVLGTRREQVRMAGNAVTPPAARDLVATVADALGIAS